MAVVLFGIAIALLWIALLEARRAFGDGGLGELAAAVTAGVLGFAFLLVAALKAAA